MRPILLRSRIFAKYLISIPLLIIIVLNVQLITQIKQFNKFYTEEKSNYLNNENKYEKVVKFQLENSKNISGDYVESFNTTTLPNTQSSQDTQNLDLIVLKETIENANKNPKIKNKFLIDNLLNNELREHYEQLNQTLKSNQTTKSTLYKAPQFLVILIQVHSRLNYLKELISSLRETKYIEQTLVIFSHDLYNEEINELVGTIDFCATLQIFYPFSLQLYPNKFPGEDPNDCPKSIGKAKALESKCANAAYPDSFGNYRESKVVQIKHHWFWKLAYVYEQLNETKNLENLHVLLLEEDHYLMPDSIHVLRKLSEKILSDIDVVSLAVFDRNKQNLEMTSLDKYAKAIWHTSNHNTGLLIARAQWKMINDCSNAFCTYDDYNWDWTLQYLCQNCFKLPLVAIYPVSSRVIHIGSCGTHHKGSNCDPKENIDKLKQTFESKKTAFFSDKFDLTGINTGIHGIKKPNGGWSDPRDHLLCKNYFQPTSQLNKSQTIII